MPEETKLTEAKAEVKATAKTTTPVKLLFATWDNKGVRHEKGEVIEVPVEMARDLLAAKKVERADPLPGEDA